jgi:hypothetical protein
MLLGRLLKGPIKRLSPHNPRDEARTNHYDVVEVVDIEGSDGRWRRWLNLSLDTRLLGYAAKE